MSVKTSPRRTTARRRQRLAATLRNPATDAKAVDLLTLQR